MEAHIATLLESILALLGTSGIKVSSEAGGALVSDVDVTTVASTGTALPSGACATGVEIQSDPANGSNIRVGGSGTNASHGFVLEPGQSYRAPVTNSNIVQYYDAAGGQTLHVVRS